MLPLTVSLKLDEKRAVMQKGSVEIKNGFWTGRFIERTAMPGGKLHTAHRRVVLGAEAELTETEARTKFAPYLESVNFGFKGLLQKSKTLVSIGDKGAIAELIVAADLMNKGYDVFRNLSPNGPADLISLKDGKLQLVQVKKRRKINGSFEQFIGSCDVLAIVSDTGKIQYLLPALPVIDDVKESIPCEVVN